MSVAEVRWPRAPSTPRPTLRPSLLAAGPCGRLSPVPSPGSTGRLFSGQHRRVDRSPRRLAEARLGPSALARPPPGLGPALPARRPSPSGTPGASPPTHGDTCVPRTPCPGVSSWVSPHPWGPQKSHPHPRHRLAPLTPACPHPHPGGMCPKTFWKHLSTQEQPHSQPQPPRLCLFPSVPAQAPRTPLRSAY